MYTEDLAGMDFPVRMTYDSTEWKWPTFRLPIIGLSDLKHTTLLTELCQVRDFCHGGTESKQQVTVLLASIEDGSEKFSLLLTGKHRSPRCFKNVNRLPTGVVPVYLNLRQHMEVTGQ
jgi:hypothetical protein